MAKFIINKLNTANDRLQNEKANECRKRKVKMLNKVSGLEVATFESIHEAERHTGIPLSNIVSCLKGRQSYTKEYSWQYVEELEK